MGTGRQAPPPCASRRRHSRTPCRRRSYRPSASTASRCPATWTAGRRVGFETRIGPLRGALGAAMRLTGGERDVFVLEAERYPQGGMPRDREAVYAEWLSRELERRSGAHLDPSHAQLISFQRTRSRYRPAGRRSEGPDAVIRGTLTVADGDAFAASLPAASGGIAPTATGCSFCAPRAVRRPGQRPGPACGTVTSISRQ